MVLKAAASKWNFMTSNGWLMGIVFGALLSHFIAESGLSSEIILAGRRLNDNMAKYASKNFVKLMIKIKLMFLRLQ